MIAISTVTFIEDGSVLVTYMDPTTDVRNRGLVIKTHQVRVLPGQGGKDYEDEIEDIRDAVKRLLKEALEDFDHTDPVELD